MKDWAESDILVEEAVTSGSSVVEVAYMAPYELAYGKWYRSRGRKLGSNPFISYYTNKKWTLEEEFNIFLLMFVQVTAVSSSYFSKLDFDIPGWIRTH